MKPRETITTSAPIAWSGLDFDLSEMDAEILAALAALAPDGGDLRALSQRASPAEVANAAAEDAIRLREAGTLRRAAALDVLAGSLAAAGRAMDALWASHEGLRNAQAIAGAL